MNNKYINLMKITSKINSIVNFHHRLKDKECFVNG